MEMGQSLREVFREEGMRESEGEGRGEEGEGKGGWGGREMRPREGRRWRRGEEGN